MTISSSLSIITVASHQGLFTRIHTQNYWYYTVLDQTHGFTLFTCAEAVELALGRQATMVHTVLRISLERFGAVPVNMQMDLYRKFVVSQAGTSEERCNSCGKLPV